jgi:hypothetical protein
MRGNLKPILALATLLLALAAAADSGPAPPPQMPGMVDVYGDGYNAARIYPYAATGGMNDRFAVVDPGGILFVDPAGGNWGASTGPCRLVASDPATPGPVEVPLANQTEWRGFRAGTTSGGPPPNITVTVCCRTQTVYLCSGTQQGTLNYTVYQGTQQVSAPCGGGVTDTQTWTCGFTGVSATDADADGVWF